MASLASINIKFLGDLSSFSKAIDNAARDMKKAGDKMQAVGSSMSLYVTAPLLAMGAVAAKAFDESAKAVAQLEAGLISTGGAVGYTSQQLQDMAADFQKNSLFDDDDILANVTDQLITFTNIAGEQFAKAEQAVLDLSTRMGKDLQSSSIMVGKALNDPIKGVTALSKAGVQFSEDQKTMIQSLMDTNDVVGAQNIILAELEKQFGGSAKAASLAGLGPFTQLKNILGDVMESFGKIILEALTPFTQSLKKAAEWVNNLSESQKKIIVIVSSLVAAIGPLLVSLGFFMSSIIPAMITGIKSLGTALTFLTTQMKALMVWVVANPWLALAAALAGIITYLVAFNRESKTAIDQQSVMSRVTNEASKSIADEKAKLSELLFIARDEKISKELRLKAIKDLNALSPEYLGNLSLEKINTEEAKVAIDRYNEALLQTARIKAAQKILEENMAKQIELELQHAQAIGKSREKTGQTIKEQMTNSLKITENDQRLISDATKIASGIEDQITKLKNEEQEILTIIGLNTQNLGVVKKTTDEIEKTANLRPKAYNLPIPETTGTIDIPTEVQPVGTIDIPKTAYKLDMIAEAAQRAHDQFLKMQAVVQQTNEAVTSAVQSMAAQVGESIGNMITGDFNFKNMFGGILGTLGGLLSQLGKIALEVGIGIKVIKESLKTLNPIVAIAAGIGLIALGRVFQNGAANIAGAYADGGIVGGSSYFGDKLLARVNSGELILNQSQQKTLYGMIEPAGANINVGLNGEFVLDGQKMRLLIDRVDSYNNRVR